MDIDTSVGMLYPLFMKIWEKNEVPTEWKKGYLIKLTKGRSQSVFKIQWNDIAVYPW